MVISDMSESNKYKKREKKRVSWEKEKKLKKYNKKSKKYDNLGKMLGLFIEGLLRCKNWIILFK
jgi:hypothetical protein